MWSPEGYGRHDNALSLSTAAPASTTTAAADQQQELPSTRASITSSSSPNSDPARAQSQPAAPFALGFMRPGSGTEVLSISRCELQDGVSNQILAAVREGCERHGLLPHDDLGGQVCHLFQLVGFTRPNTVYVMNLIRTPAPGKRLKAQSHNVTCTEPSHQWLHDEACCVAIIEWALSCC